MKKLSQFSAFLCIAMILLLSFKPGGDVYEIYLGKERLVQHLVHSEKTVPAIRIKQENANDELSVFYNHCGRLGNDRSITLRTKDSKVQKSWRFSDKNSTTNLISGSKFMKVKAGEIVHLKKLAGKNQLELYYYSKEIPEGILLARVE